MKKITLVLVLLLTSLMIFSSCGKKESKTADGTEVVMGFIYVGPIGDGGWTYAHEQARLVLEKETGIRTIYKESVPEGAEVKDVVRSMVDQGANIIAATSFGFMDYIVEMAAQFPDVKFIHCSGYKMAENMGNYFGRIYEARFLSGLVAGMKTKTNKIGYVAAFEIPEVVRGINAFTLGVKAVNPEATVNVRWTHTWYDPAKEKEGAKALLDEGCDVIAQHQDTAGPQQAAEERGMFSVGYNTDMTRMAPNAHMTAPVWNWGMYYVRQVKEVIAGTWKPESYWGGIKDGIVNISPLTKNAPEGAQKKVDEMKNLITAGKFHPFQGPIKDQTGKVKVPAGKTLTDSELLSIDWFVEGVVGKISKN